MPALSSELFESLEFKGLLAAVLYSEVEISFIRVLFPARRIISTANSPRAYASLVA